MSSPERGSQTTGERLKKLLRSRVTRIGLPLAALAGTPQLLENVRAAETVAIESHSLDRGADYLAVDLYSRLVDNGAFFDRQLADTVQAALATGYHDVAIDYYEEHDQTDKAQQLMRSVAEDIQHDQPDRAAAYYIKLGETAQAKQVYEQAAQAMQNTLDEDDPTSSALQTLANYWTKAGNNASAQRYYTQAAKKSNEPFQKLHLLELADANAQMKAEEVLPYLLTSSGADRNYNQAAALYREAFTQTPQVEFAKQLAELALAKSYFDDATFFLEHTGLAKKEVQLKVTDHRCDSEDWSTEYMVDLYQVAGLSRRQALERLVQNLYRPEHKASVYEELGQTTEAQEHWEQAAQFAEDPLLKADYYRKAGKTTEAEQVVQTAVTKATQEKHYQEAARLQIEGLRISPKVAYAGVAEAALETQEYSSAIFLFEQAGESQRVIEAQRAAAQHYDAMQQYGQAAELYTQLNETTLADAAWTNAATAELSSDYPSQYQFLRYAEQAGTERSAAMLQLVDRLVSLKQYDTADKLYIELHLEDKRVEMWEQVVTQATQEHNYAHAAYLADSRLHDQERSQKLLRLALSEATDRSVRINLYIDLKDSSPAAKQEMEQAATQALQEDNDNAAYFTNILTLAGYSPEHIHHQAGLIYQDKLQYTRAAEEFVAAGAVAEAKQMYVLRYGQLLKFTSRDYAAELDILEKLRKLSS